MYPLADRMPVSFRTQGYLDLMKDQMQKTFGQNMQVTFIASLISFLVVLAIVNIIILVWYKSDQFMRTGQKAGSGSLVLAFLFGPLFLAFYCPQRPKGKSVICFHCGKSKLKEAPICFWCNKADVERHNPLHDPDRLKTPVETRSMEKKDPVKPDTQKPSPPSAPGASGEPKPFSVKKLK